MRRRLRIFYIFIILAFSGHMRHAFGNENLPTLFEYSVEALMDYKITSAAKKEQEFFKVPSAIYILTQEDIRRSGATNIPELLRMVPGVEVARLQVDQWAVSTRGFNSTSANKQLVMIDGRSIYSPLFGLVFWNQHDVVLEDIERIEVIRGPGATVWGANAVNGVINIITRHTRDTQGGLVSGGGGTDERGFGTIRYGGKAGEKATYRAFVKYFNRDGFAGPAGGDDGDEWEAFRGGLRVDWDVSDDDSLMLQGGAHQGDARRGTVRDTQFSAPFVRTFENQIDLSTGYVLGSWHHLVSDTSDWTFKSYYDRSEVDQTNFHETRDTVDLDFTHRFVPLDRNEIICGLGYRYTSDEFPAIFDDIRFIPQERSDDIFSLFVQDEITLSPDRLTATLGSKFEHNDYSGFEFQPSGRLMWLPHEKHAFWGSVSRAVRSPSRLENDLFADVVNPGAEGASPTLLRLLGNPKTESEELLAFELGHRMTPTSQLFFATALFYNIYDSLLSVETETPFMESEPVAHTVIPVMVDNLLEGETYGIDFWGTWQVMENWKLMGGYSFIELQLHAKDFSTDMTTAESTEENSPEHRFYLRSYLDLPHHFELDVLLYYVDELSSGEVSDYVRLDARVGWKPVQNLEVSLVAQNTLEEEHEEFVNGNQIERSFYGKVTYYF